MKINNYEIKNETDNDTAELLLYGIVGSYWDELDAKDIVQDIRALDVKEIVVRIYSDGGSVFAGIAIHNALKFHSAQIRIVVDSIAASIASVIAMAGDVVEMPENAFMMIHNPTAWQGGEADDMLKMADILNKVKDSLLGVYQGKTGIELETLSTMMDDETWLPAAEAVELGFADTLIGQADVQNLKKIVNKLTSFKNIPDQIKTMIQNNNPTTPAATAGKDESMEITLELIKNKHPEIAKALKAEGTKDGATAERERIQAVEACIMPGHEDLINELKFDGTTTGGDAAQAVVAAEKAIRINAGKALKTDTVEPVVNALPEDTPEDLTPKKGEILDEAGFKANAELCDEFDGDFDAYQNYAKAVKNGNVRVLGK